ncbi:MAG: LptF/LptG family permease [Alphaproteobacteria bacterium]|nr:LptF/LptG family permease [Alphaproteobacteria bacterium]
MNRILTLYLLRQLAAAFAFATGAVTFVVLFTQSFRLLSLVLDNSSTIVIFFQLLALSALTFLPLIMPLGLGTAVVFVYHRLAVDSELAVMRSAGLSLMRLIEPALMLAAAVTLVCFAMTLWITPAANRGLVQLQYKMRDSYAVFLSHPGSFNDLAEGLTFYANKRGPNGSLEGILIHDVRNPDDPVTTMAATGQVVDGGTGQPHMIIFNGRRQEFDRTTGKLSELSFDQYVLDLDALRNSSTSRLPDPREMDIAELLNPEPEILRARGPMSHFIGELNSRLAIPFLSLSYALIGLATILMGAFNRRGMSGRILAGALCIVVLQAGFMTVNGMAARDSGWTFLLYLIAVLPAPVALVLLNSDDWRPFQRLRGVAP